MITVAMRPAALDERVDEAAYGGKAAQLAAAVRAGLPVPRGVAVGVDVVDAIAAGDTVALGELERAIAGLTWPLAVRSSAVGEDSAVASFAGQHLTCLNVCSPSALIQAVRAIFASARSGSALAYRRRLGVGGEPRIGVVVQELVMADRAGVLFSCDPVTGADEIVIEAAWGLGEAVVAGLVTPDRYRLSPEGRVLERAIGLKDVAVRATADGGTRQTPVAAGLSRVSCLDDSDLERLGQLAARCDETFGGRQDLEWAFAGDRLYLLQRRAVTRAPRAA
jgi:pyruvate, water dikinase